MKGRVIIHQDEWGEIRFIEQIVESFYPWLIAGRVEWTQTISLPTLGLVFKQEPQSLTFRGEYLYIEYDIGCDKPVCLPIEPISFGNGETKCKVPLTCLQNGQLVNGNQYILTLYRQEEERKFPISIIIVTPKEPEQYR